MSDFSEGKEEKLGENLPAEMDNATGFPPARQDNPNITSRFKQFRSPASILALSIILTVLAITFAFTSFSAKLVYTPPAWVPYNPQNAIVVLQLLATLSLMAIRESFVMCCELLRWSVASKRINFITFIAMSEATNFSGLMSIICSRNGPVFARWRMIAMFRILIVYVVLILAQFVWLLNINPRTAYKVEKRTEDFNPEYQFFINNGIVNPFTRLDLWHHLNDATKSGH